MVVGQTEVLQEMVELIGKNDLEFDPSTCFEIINQEFTP